jgi:hypothetical protein
MTNKLCEQQISEYITTLESDENNVSSDECENNYSNLTNTLR